MPHVASQASVLKPPHSGPTQRERAGEPNDSASPFSILLAETGSAPPPARHHSSRPLGTAPAQRTDAPRAAHRSDAGEAPSDADVAADAPEAGATEAPTAEQTDGAAAEQFQVAATGQAAAETPALSLQGADDGEDAANEDGAAHPAFATAVETPAPPAPPPQSAVADALLPAAPAPAATPAPAPAEPQAPSETDAGEPPAIVPGSEIATGTPDPGTGVTAPAAATPESPQPPQATQGTEQAPQRVQAPATAPAKPPVVEQAATSEPATEGQPSTTTPDAVTSGASTPAPEQTEAKPMPKHASHADAPAQPSPRANAPDAPERPQTANAVSDFAHANQPTPDNAHLAHLQNGREFGQSVAATAQAAHAGANASNPLASAPVPIESLAVQIATRAQGGSNRFEIRLDPPELGRIDVRLDIDRSGNVTSRLVVEKAETLDVLRRDAHQLERALQDAGLKTSDNSLQFSLRDQSFTGRDDRGGSDAGRTLVADPELPAAEGAPLAYGLTLRGGSGIDIRV